MRSYRQYCGLARALDLVGDRWTLLIVRELLILGPLRYSDLLRGLPGIATNLLADRLRDLEAVGLVERHGAHPPVATSTFQLTPRGRDLHPVIKALGAWAGPTLGPWESDQEFRSHWLALPLELHLADRSPTRAPITLEVRPGDRPLVVTTENGAVRVRPGTAPAPDAVVSGRPDLVLALLLGRLSITAAKREGVHVEGNPNAIRRLQPRAATLSRSS